MGIIESSDDVIILFGVLIGLMVVSLLVVAVLKNRENAQNSAEPIFREQAKLIDKPQLNEGVTFYAWVLFETESGKRVRVRLNNSELSSIASIIVGDSGQLIWQGNHMISFDRRS